MTLESIAGQCDVSVECIVVEQDTAPRLTACLPAWVRHVFLPSPEVDLPYCRAWTLNVGARYATGRLLVLHDNDIVVSEHYACSSLERFDQGYDVVDLKRYGFYLSESHTAAVFGKTAGFTDLAPEGIRQNQTGGASLAIGREAFFRIGGMDEAFVGWGGEDNEFWDRAETLRVWPYGCMPIIHLWHPAQPRKGDPGNPTLQRYRDLMVVEPSDRIARLRELPFGSLAGPMDHRVTATHS